MLTEIEQDPQTGFPETSGFTWEIRAFQSVHGCRYPRDHGGWIARGHDYLHDPPCVCRHAAVMIEPANIAPVQVVPMTVYVDDAVHPWQGDRWAHLLADTLDELHAFAARLGLPRRAFQNKTSGAHYDVNVALRAQAIGLGAVPISRHVDRARVRAVIANAKRQGRGETP